MRQVFVTGDIEDEVQLARQVRQYETNQPTGHEWGYDEWSREYESAIKFAASNSEWSCRKSTEGILFRSGRDAGDGESRRNVNVPYGFPLVRVGRAQMQACVLQVFVLRKRASHELVVPGARFYICSLSLKTVVYKGLLTSQQLWVSQIRLKASFSSSFSAIRTLTDRIWQLLHGVVCQIAIRFFFKNL